jgi:hypothetical protein
VNASGTMIRRASELDVGNRLVVGGAVREVVRVVDIRSAGKPFVSIFLDNGCAIVECPSTLYTCVAA